MPKSTEELYKELLQQSEDYQKQANDYLSAYDNRGQFLYDAETDPMYQSLKNQYVHQGRRAMEDTMGQAAGLTGGYGSTYAQGVGNQAYNEYLTKLNAQIPGLAQQARENWDAEGDRLLNRYNLALNAASTAYGQARDALGDLRYDTEWNYNKDRDSIADQRYQQEWEYNKSRDAASDARYQQEWEYKKSQDELDRQWQQKQFDADQAYRDWQMGKADKDDARDIAMMMLQAGLMPGDDLLSSAGISSADAKSIVDYYKAMQAAASSGGSGGGSYRGGGGYDYQPQGDPAAAPANQQKTNVMGDIVDNVGQGGAKYLTKNGARAGILTAYYAGNRDAANQILEQVSGNLSDAEMQELVEYMEGLFGKLKGGPTTSYSMPY